MTRLSFLISSGDPLANILPWAKQKIFSANCMQLAENIFCLAHGKMLANGSPDEIKNDKRVIDAYLGVQ